jgi:hypothetical protein
MESLKRKEISYIKKVGCIYKSEYINKTTISDESDEFFKNFIKENGLSIETYEALKAGDATFHAG